MHIRHKIGLVLLIFIILFVVFVKFTCYGQHGFSPEVTGNCNECQCKGLFDKACKSYEDCVNVSGDFCGTSTNGICQTPSDCVTDGCSGQVCKSVSEAEIITTCEMRSCYNSSKYWKICDCVDNKCQWATTG